MSDGSTDAARDNQRNKAINEWLLATLRFAITWSHDDRVKVEAAAKESDSVPRGYFGGRTNLATFSNSLCAALLAGTARDAAQEALLKRHVERISEQRIRAPYEAVIKATGPWRSAL